MNIALIEPYYGGSHKYWADKLLELSTHSVHMYSMPARYWKWRMQGSAYQLCEEIKSSKKIFDAFLVSDMIDLALFNSLVFKFHPRVPLILYMHENQLCYPFSKKDKQKNQEFGYGYLNYKSCLAADKILFNSNYHLKVFLEACRSLLLKMPDFPITNSLESIHANSSVLAIGLDLDKINEIPKSPLIQSQYPVILWNHRWDDDKNPVFFQRFLNELRANNDEFRLILTRQSSNKTDIYREITKMFEDKILFNGFAKDYEQYIGLLKSSDYLFVSPGHDFFGISMLEAAYCGAIPLLPPNAVYDEHLPPGKYSQFYYTNINDIVHKFQSKIHTDSDLLLEMQNEIYKYNWKTVIQSYDNYFSQLIS